MGNLFTGLLTSIMLIIIVFNNNQLIYIYSCFVNIAFFVIANCFEFLHCVGLDCQTVNQFIQRL